MTHRISGLDGLRALACILVVAHHILPRLPQDGSLISTVLQTFGNLAQAGVSVFFVLSGFLLALPFWRAADRGAPVPSLRRYLIHRFARIVPGFYLAIAVSFALSLTLGGSEASVQNILRFISGLLFVNSFDAITLFPTDLNGPLWSIGFEVFSYMLLFTCLLLALVVFRQPTFRQLGAVFSASLVLTILLHLLWVQLLGLPQEGVGWDYGLIGFARTWVPFTNVFALFGHFVIGVLFAGIHLKVSQRFKPQLLFDLVFVFGSMVLLALLAGLFVVLDDGFGGVMHMLYMWPVFPMFIGFCLVTLPLTALWRHAFDWQPLRYLATISFGVYIWHMVFVELVSRLVFTDFIYGGGMSLSHWFAATVLTLTLTVITAQLSWRWLESPVLEKAKQFRAPASLALQRVDRLAD